MPTETTLSEYKHIYFFLYLSFQYYRLHSTLFRDIDESLLYSTDSDEEDPFFLMPPSAVEAKDRGSGGQRLLADPLSVSGGGGWFSGPVHC